MADRTVGDARWASAPALLLVTAALRAPSFMRAYLSDDEAIYAVMGRAMAGGARVYADVADHKPPAIYWLYETAHRVGGPAVAMTLVHLLTIFVVWATALVIGRIALHGARDTTGSERWGALLYVVFTATMVPFDSLAANAELLMMLPAALSILLVLNPRGRSAIGAALAGGALLSVAGAFKYQAAVQAPVLLWLVAGAPRVTPRARMARLAAAFIGLALPWALIVLWFYAQGTLGEALYWFRFNFAYIGAGSRPAEVAARALPRIALVVLPATLLYAAALARVRELIRDRDPARWLIAWAGLSAIAVATGHRYFGHYFHQLTVPLAVLAAPICARFASRRPALVFAGLAIPALAFTGISAGLIPVLRPEPDYAAVVRWLDERDPRRGSICVWGNSPVLLALAERPLGCRFVSANFLTGASPATASQTDPLVDASPNIVPGMWTRLAADLSTRRPAFILDASVGDVARFGKFPPRRYPELWSVLEREYDDIGVVAGIRVFRRRPGI